MNEITIVFSYLFWHFVEFPKRLSAAFLNFLRFWLRFFSIPFLFKTLFSYWHRIYWQPPRGFNLGLYFEVLLSNLISRGIGFILRSFLIFVGIFFEILTVFVWVLALVIWYLLPLLLIFFFFHGLRILFKV